MAPIEKNTNQLFRKKYFVESNDVIRSKPAHSGEPPPRSAGVIPRSKVIVSDIKVPINAPQSPASSKMQISVSKENNRISGISIKCPCGRHAELDLNYDAKAARP